MRAVDETAGQLLDQGGASLRRAEQFLQDTKEHLSDAIRSGQRVVDPTPAATGA